MYAYCNNNPIMFLDTSGHVGVLSALALGIILVSVLFIPSSQDPKAAPTSSEIEAARSAADQAELQVIEGDSDEYPTIYIHIDTGSVLETVDNNVYHYYYQRLYDRTVEMAKDKGIPTKNLMSVFHISWEFELHVIAYKAGFDSAVRTDLNVEETPWSMIWRAIK